MLVLVSTTFTPTLLSKRFHPCPHTPNSLDQGQKLTQAELMMRFSLLRLQSQETKKQIFEATAFIQASDISPASGINDHWGYNEQDTSLLEGIYSSEGKTCYCNSLSYTPCHGDYAGVPRRGTLAVLQRQRKLPSKGAVSAKRRCHRSRRELAWGERVFILSKGNRKRPHSTFSLVCNEWQGRFSWDGKVVSIMKALVRLYKVWTLCWGPWESWTRVFSRGVSHSDVYSNKIPVVSVRGNMLEEDIPVRTLWKKSRHKMMLAGISQWQWEETEWMAKVCLGWW